MILEIPAGAPWFTPNGRRHWAQTQALVKAWRALGFIAARPHAHTHGEFTEPVIITAVVHKTTNRIYDPANLLGGSVKAAIDGLVDAGLLIGDDPRYVVETRSRAGEKRAQACLVLEVVSA